MQPLSQRHSGGRASSPAQSERAPYPPLQRLSSAVIPLTRQAGTPALPGNHFWRAQLGRRCRPRAPLQQEQQQKKESK